MLFKVMAEGCKRTFVGGVAARTGCCLSARRGTRRRGGSYVVAPVVAECGYFLLLRKCNTAAAAMRTRGEARRGTRRRHGRIRHAAMTQSVNAVRGSRGTARAGRRLGTFRRTRRRLRRHIAPKAMTEGGSIIRRIRG